MCVCVWMCVRARVGRVGTRARGHVDVASLIQHAMRISHIVTSFPASLAPPYFSTLSHKWRDSRKKVTEHKMRVSIFSTNFDENVSQCNKNLARYCQMWQRLHVKYPLFLSDFNETWIFSTDFWKKALNIKFHQNPCSESWVVPYRQMDMTKLVVVFRNFANAPYIPALATSFCKRISETAPPIPFATFFFFYMEREFWILITMLLNETIFKVLLWHSLLCPLKLNVCKHANRYLRSGDRTYLGQSVQMCVGTAH
jgi:hypothetical protein